MVSTSNRKASATKNMIHSPRLRVASDCGGVELVAIDDGTSLSFTGVAGSRVIAYQCTELES